MHCLNAASAELEEHIWPFNQSIVVFKYIYLHTFLVRVHLPGNRPDLPLNGKPLCLPQTE